MFCKIKETKLTQGQCEPKSNQAREFIVFVNWAFLFGECKTEWNDFNGNEQYRNKGN